MSNLLSFVTFSIVSFFLLLSPTALRAQEGSTSLLQGTVLDSRQQGVDHATIGLKNLKSGAIRHTATDTTGHFSLALPAGSDWELNIQSVGYDSISRRVRIGKQDKSVSFYLKARSAVLEPLEVSAIRAGDHAPFAKTNITAADIRQNNLGRDLPYVLEQTPNVVINSDAGNGMGYTGIHIRGSDGTRTNVTLNGIPYNDAESSGSFFVDVPDLVSSVGSIQVQRGVGTSSNGAGAFGATINLSTNEVHKEPYVSLSNSAGSYNSWKNTIQAGSGLIDGKFTADVRLSRVSSDGYIQRASSDLQSLMFSTAYIGKKTTVRFNFITGKEKTYQAWDGVAASIIDSVRNYNELGEKSDGTFYDNQTDNYTQTHYQLFITHQFNDRWSFSLASFLTRGIGYYEEYKNAADYSAYGLSNPDTAVTDLIRRQYLDNYFYGETFSLQYKKAKDLFTLGGSWTNYDGGHYGQVIWAQNGAIPKDYEYYNLPAYKYDKNIFVKWMHDFAGYWHFFADMQYRNVWHKMDGFEDEPDQRIKRNFNFINPKVGISYAENGYNAYASYALANKEPNRDDFESRLQDPPKREQLHDFELGLEKKSASYSWSANLYYMLYKDQLVLTGALNDVGSPTRINVPNSYRAGLELQAGYKIAPWVNATANFAVSRNKIKTFTAYYQNYDADGNELPQKIQRYKNRDIAFSPDMVGAATVNFLPVKHLNVSLVGKYVSRQFLDNTQNNERSLGAYYNQGLRVSYQINTRLFKNLELIAQLYNLFNTFYNTNGATYPEYDNGELQNWIYYFPAAGTHFMAGVNIDL